MFKFAAIAIVLSASNVFAQSSTLLLTSPPALADSIDAFPKLVGDDPMFALINADLSKRDADALAQSQDCLSEEGSDWSRFIGVTFAGPHYLNYVETNDYACMGAAHPNADTSSVAYDLTTGRAVDWRELLPPALVASLFVDYSTSGDVVGSAALTALYLAHYSADTDADCPLVVRNEELGFIFRLDATERAVMMFPASLPHAVQVCAEAATIPLAELRSLGAPADLIEALTAN
jgi:hypothetical protein